MNCANHSDQAAVAFCRTCGKPLCNQCTRDVRGVIYCESCLAARMEGAPAAPGSPYTPPPQPNVFTPVGGPSVYVPPPIPPVSSGPNPTVAGILAGFFPFGVGAVYCSQYAKGLAHLAIMVLLIIGVSSDVPWYMHMFLGLGIGFFYVYQIIDAVRTARALQLGEPAPDPFGLGSMFGANPSPTPAIPGTKAETKVPVAAVILIGLGVLFLINTAFDFSLHRYWPVILIVLGVYLFAKHWGLLGTYQPGCVCERCRTRKLMGPAMLVTLGILFLLDNTSNIDFGKTWPAILLVVGVVKLLQSNASSSGHRGPLPPGSGGYPPSAPPPAAPATFQGAAENPSAQSIDPSSGEVKNV
jgi:LiaF transmembrane domain/B-box zinc finger